MRALVWITGASSGIGRALVETVPSEEVRLIGISRRDTPGVEHVTADLADPAGWARVGESFASALADFDGDRVVLVHCAATLAPIGFAGEVDADAYHAQVVLNSAAPQVIGEMFIRAVEPLGVEAHLVMLTSGAARSVYEGWSAYGAGKAAVDHWVRIVGAERRRRGSRIRLLSVAPGVVATRMQAEVRATSDEDFPSVERFRDLHDDGELADPHDVARRLWSLLDRDLDNGAVVDLRTLDE